MNKRTCGEIKMHLWVRVRQTLHVLMSRNFGKQVQWDGLGVPDTESNIPTIRALPLVSLPLKWPWRPAWYGDLSMSAADSYHKCWAWKFHLYGHRVPEILHWWHPLNRIVKCVKKCHVEEPAARLARPLSISGPRHAILQQEGIVRLQQVRVVALSRRKNYSTACGCLFLVAEERKDDRLLLEHLETSDR